MGDDAFGEVLSALDFSGELYFRAELGGAFGIAVPPRPGVLRFHVVAEGRCHVAVDDAPPCALGRGDLVLVPHGAAHVLSDAPGRRPQPLDVALRAGQFAAPGPFVHGHGSRTVLACGHFAFGAGEGSHPLIDTLPALLHLPAGHGRDFAWVEALLRHGEAEARADRPGSGAVLRRVSEILCIEVLRAFARHGGAASLSVLADPQLGRALWAMHAEPAADWSLEALARTAGLSRTLFAERFRERLGMPPMRYLATWRMHKARRLLATDAASIGEVARRVGYASESSFHRTFREAFGKSPGAWRRSVRRGAADDAHGSGRSDKEAGRRRRSNAAPEHPWECGSGSARRSGAPAARRPPRKDLP